jgi:hypothetical protein
MKALGMLFAFLLMSASAKLTALAGCLHGNGVLFFLEGMEVVQLCPPSLNNMDRSIYAEVVRLARSHVEVKHQTRPCPIRFELTL